MIKQFKQMENNCHIPDLVQVLSYEEKWWIEHGFIALNLSLVYESRIKFHYIYNDALTKHT